jgi:histidinol dehydrogenase
MIRILEWDSLSASDRAGALARPAQESRGDIAAVAAEVVNTVRRQGDAALFSYTERFDSVKLDSLAVSAEEFAEARKALTPQQLAALEAAIANVQQFHAGQLPQPLAVETVPGVRCERIVRAISTVGLYVPAGSAPLPSAVVMLAVPARIAGCPNRILCTPPARNGKANAAVLVAAELCGIKTVFKVGGAQAIAALAYGTQTIPKADKIFGPGNAYVTAAKQLVAADPAGAACDMPAGPSEVMVVADDNASAEFVASDLLAQAEHDAQAQAILVTSSRRLGEAVRSEVEKQTALLSRRAILQESLAASRCIVVSDIATAIEVANLYAAEHLILEVEEPRQWLPRIQNAGSVFLGAWSPEPMGDYCSGTNHVLPTYGYARAYSGLSVLDFVKGITVQELSPAGLQGLGPVAVELARLEGLDAHASAVTRRLDVLNRAGAASGAGANSAAVSAAGGAANTGASGRAGAAS